MAASKYGKALVGLIKRGWDEMPEVMASSVFAIYGVGLAGYALYRHHRDDGFMKTYKYIYTIYRHDDPKVARLRKYNMVN